MDPKVKDYLLKKYYPSYSSLPDDEEERSELQKSRMTAGMVQGGMEALGGLSPRPTGINYLAGFGESRGARREIDSPRQDYSSIGKAGQMRYDEGLERMKSRRAEALQSDQMNQAAEKMGREDRAFKQKTDASDPMAVRFKTAIKQAMPEVVGNIKDWDEMTLEDLEMTFPLVYKQYADKLAADSERYRANIAAGEKADRRAEQKAREEERYNDKLDKQTQDLSGDISGVQDMFLTFDAVERSLGAPLESFEIDQKSKELKKRNDRGELEPVDLPGVSMWGLGRVSAYSSDARQLSNAMEKLFNVTLKDRSGAAVTSTELERLRSEFSQGKFNTEAEMIDAMKRFKAAAFQALQNKEAAYSPEVVNRYQSRGGMTSSVLAPGARSLQSFGGPGPLDDAIGDGINDIYSPDAVNAELQRRAEERAKGGR
jgi:ABC-type sulfate transport system substrate-binding protein